MATFLTFKLKILKINLLMNTFVSIEQAIAFKRVTFYTVRFEGKEQSMFFNFINEHAKSEELYIIRSWLRKLGTELGAQPRYFRPEGYGGGEARALPPPPRYLNVDCHLRLYCMWMSRSAVFLFNGGVKTAATAQDCPNVRPHFFLANKLTKAISQAQVDGDISLDPETDLLLYDQSLELEI